MPGHRGFTLIEALVALSVLALTAITLLGVAETHVIRIDGLESRAAAQWVAENRLAEIQVQGMTGAGQPVTLLGRRWQVDTSLQGTEDPDLSAVEIHVSEVGSGQPQAIFNGFLDTGAMPR